MDERYEVLQLLGEGGMGCVYRVRHRVLGRLFALKVLRPELARDSALAERFLQEARAQAAITHPHVVSITDFGMLDHGQPYFVMELLEGRTLSSVLRDRGALEPAEVVLIARSVAGALAAAHAVGVIHRDLKPDNITMLGDASVPTSLKVLDFGLAMLLGVSRITRDDIVYGTPHYMSPEQAAGEPIDPRVDIYALGILMYEMLTGRVPFEADSYMGVLTKQLYAEPTPPSLVCPTVSRCAGLEDVVLCCLRKEREARFADMLEVIEALDGLGIDLALVDAARTRIPATIHPSRGSRKVMRKTRRLRLWAYTGVGVAALGLALGLLFGRLVGSISSARGDGSAAPVLDNTALQGEHGAAVSAQPVDSSADQRLPLAPDRGGSRASTRAMVVQSAGNRSVTRVSGRSTGQLSRLGERYPSEPAGGSSGSFGNMNTPGSGEIANPWAK